MCPVVGPWCVGREFASIECSENHSDALEAPPGVSWAPHFFVFWWMNPDSNRMTFPPPKWNEFEWKNLFFFFNSLKTIGSVDPYISIVKGCVTSRSYRSSRTPFFFLVWGYHLPTSFICCCCCCCCFTIDKRNIRLWTLSPCLF